MGEIKANGKDAMYRVSTVDNLTINIYETRLSMGTHAAEMVTLRIHDLLQDQPFVNIIFAAAPSQNEFLAALVQYSSIEWARVNAFHMDEYIGLPEGHPAKFSAFLKEKILDKLPFHSVNIINGDAADPVEECRHYTKLLERFPPDIVCMGIGENGHIAFNDPHVADFNDPQLVKIASLDDECRQQQVNDSCFKELSDVPTHAITLTTPALMAGKYIYCVVPGAKKTRAVYNTLNEPVLEKYPSTILRKHRHAILFLDKDSSALL